MTNHAVISRSPLNLHPAAHDLINYIKIRSALAVNLSHARVRLSESAYTAA